MSLVYSAIIFLTAAVIIVPIFKKIGLGSVLGYLTAGILIGPWGFGFIAEVEDILHFAELGVVLLLFIIGLELQPSRLRVMRRPIFGTGGLQVFASILVIFVLALAANMEWRTALVMGCCLSLSSTAFALQLLGERDELVTQHGRTAFAILLFQDLIVIPMLALLPLLSHENNMSFGGDQLLAAGTAIAVIIGVIAAGHFLIKPLLKWVALSNNTELFSAASLLVVLGTAGLMYAAGLSMALGAFLAGVLLADSEFRHELEANIEPFKGLLLGLFFISVGMSVDLGLIVKMPVLLVSMAIALVLIKAAILFGIAKLNKQSNASALNLAVIISQGGEFAFVLLHQAGTFNVIDKSISNILVVIVTLSMVITPLLLILTDYWKNRTAASRQTEPEYDQIDDDEPKVIIAGFGRFGQIIARILRMKKIPFTALESSFEQVDFVRKFGNKIYFGDAARLDLLRAARADKASIFVLSIVDTDASIKVAEAVKKHFPHLKIFARARNRQHVYKLMDIGVDYVIRETFLSSIELAKQILIGMKIEDSEAEKITTAFKEYDQALVQKQHAIHHDEEQVIASARHAAAELESLFEEDTGSDIDHETQPKHS